MRLAFFPGATLEHYRALEEALGDAPVPSQRLVFAVGSTDEGLQVVQVWESREALELFNQQWLFPAMTRLGTAGFPQPPVVRDCETHDLHVQPAR